MATEEQILETAVTDNRTSAKPRHSICLFAPYFGTIPSYMPMFLKSCAWNPTIQWFIHSDSDWSAFSVPENVKIIPTTLQWLTEQAERILECKICMPRAYKLCDLRPTYGVVFAELAQGFDFWGHSDLDMFFGDLRRFLPPDALDNSLRMYENGHLSLYRNDEQGRNVFRIRAEKAEWRSILADPVHQVFDEYGINEIFREQNLPVYRDFDACATIGPTNRDFCVYREKSSKRPRVFTWRNGKTFREWYENGQFQRRELAYVHIMRRPMVLAAPELVNSCDNWLMVPNVFIPTGPTPLSAADMQELNKPSWEHRARWQIKRVHEYWERRRGNARLRKQYGYRSE